MQQEFLYYSGRQKIYMVNRLCMSILKTHEYLLLIDVGNTVREYGQKYSIRNMQRDVWCLNEEVETVIGLQQSDAVQFMNGHVESFALDT